MADAEFFAPDLRSRLLAIARALDDLQLQLRQLLENPQPDRLPDASIATPVAPTTAPSLDNPDQAIESTPPRIAPKPEHAARLPSDTRHIDYRSHPKYGAVQATQNIPHDVDVLASTTGHVLLITKEKKFLACAVDGIAVAHAGVMSNWPQFLRVGDGGIMGPGSRVVLAERDGNTLRIMGTMPYAGISWGTFPATRLRGQTKEYQRFEVPLELSMAALGMTMPPLPVGIAKKSNTSGFGIPAEARREIWLYVQQMLRRPTE